MGPRRHSRRPRFRTNLSPSLPLEDFWLTRAKVPFAIYCVYAIFGSNYGLGMRDDDLNNLLIMRGTEYMYYCQLTIAISVPFTKSSIAVTVMRKPDIQHLAVR